MLHVTPHKSTVDVVFRSERAVRQIIVRHVNPSVTWGDLKQALQDPPYRLRTRFYIAGAFNGEISKAKTGGSLQLELLNLEKSWTQDDIAQLKESNNLIWFLMDSTSVPDNHLILIARRCGETKSKLRHTATLRQDADWQASEGKPLRSGLMKKQLVNPSILEEWRQLYRRLSRYDREQLQEKMCKTSAWWRRHGRELIRT